MNVVFFASMDFTNAKYVRSGSLSTVFDAWSYLEILYFSINVEIFISRNFCVENIQ